MNNTLQASLLENFCHRFTSQDSLSLLANYQLIPQLLCESIIDRAIYSIECTPKEIESAYQQFYQQWNLVTKKQQQLWQLHCGLSPVQFEAMITRSLQIEKFKQQTWGRKIESYFLQRKQEFDRAIYSLLRTKDLDVAQELFFRVSEGEQSFAELAQQYSEGSEAETGGLLGPVELGMLHTELAELLHTSSIGHVQPIKLGEWCMIVRLEKLIPAQLDDQMRDRLLQERFDTWLQEQVQQLDDRDKVWFGIVQEQLTDAVAA
ncbi:peptidylprolyl isomerase [Leptolyngbya sp. FACHB-671]|uniref:peptidylprolyl isomerase n=1 Tax=Leptolyngbya sp. FACHB-671 TaxID=2692812 RepID=UPI00168720CA|nr:peptidylprolyl isomerase [Leptolyngbya sp. FACHB-671]MBD2066080.1 peptidylprolyl isomerase [Leptolyngbya sp. FACHB-671]